ncbi:MAG: hypothetical protein AAF840_01595 [Bacteroidota bacterium]
MSPTTAAGNLAIKTVGTPGPTMGPPTCGMGGKPGVTIGQVCISVRRAAGGITVVFSTEEEIFGARPQVQKIGPTASEIS